MEYKKILVSLVAVLAICLAISSVSAFVANNQVSVEVIGIRDAGSNSDISVVAGQEIPVRVIFTPFANATDVQVEAEVTGGRGYSSVTPEFDVIAGRQYSRFLTVQVPSNIDPSERMMLEITISSDETGRAATVNIPLTAQRESHLVEVLDVSMDNQVQAGDNLALDIVLKNRGSHFSEDTFVKVSVPALGIERRAYFGDLSPVDQSRPDKEDAVERRMVLSIPANAPAGVYALELEAFTEDSSTTVSRRFAVSGSSGSMVVSSSTTKTFGVGENEEFSLTLVNSGRNVQVYEVSVDAPTELDVETDETVIVVPAGSSRTVKMDVEASEAGRHPFTVSVFSNGNLVEKKSFTADVEGKARKVGGSTNTTVVLTVVLAIIFIVLLVVLIVLLTRKPQRSEEFGESYY